MNQPAHSTMQPGSWCSRRLNESAELGTTTAIITHNAAIADMADRVLRMRSGQIAEVRRNERKPHQRIWSGEDA